jgi:long-subunit fatty acid transport protein
MIVRNRVPRTLGLSVRHLATVCVAVFAMTPAGVSANPEPTAYDVRSIGMARTGTSYMERASAIVFNPANMEGVEKLGFTFTFNAIMTKTTAPLMGPNTAGSGRGFGPLPAGFLAGRIAPRVVFGAGIVIEAGYGATFDGVVCFDGDPVTPDPRDVSDANEYIPDTNPATCTNPAAEDVNLTFFIGEASLGTSFRINDKFWLGVALRLPFSKQIADAYQNIGAALGTVAYGRVENDLSGVGFPSPRFGFTIKPHRKVSIGLMYRMWSRITLSGATTTKSIPTLPVLDNTVAQSVGEWNIPHAFQVGISYKANPRLLLAGEFRMQFHSKEKSGNQNQHITATVDPPVPGGQPIEVNSVIGFGWKNAWDVRLGAEYRFRKADLLSIRGGLSVGPSASVSQWATYFTPPPGFGVAPTAGLGFYWNDRNDPSIKDKYQLDIAGLFGLAKTTNGNEWIGTEQTIPGTSDTQILCSADQVARTGCPGTTRVISGWFSVGFTLQY